MLWALLVLLGPCPSPELAGLAHRSVLALHAGAVEPQGGHPLLIALDVQDALVASLARLRLGQVLGLQRDRLDHFHRHQDLLCLQQLGTVLGREKTTRQVSTWVSQPQVESSDASQPSHFTLRFNQLESLCISLGFSLLQEYSRSVTGKAQINR